MPAGGRLTQKPRRIQTAGKWRETEEGMLYAVVAKSGGEVLASADVTLATADFSPGPAGESVIPERLRREIEDEIEELVRQQAVRVLDRRG